MQMGRAHARTQRISMENLTATARGMAPRLDTGKVDKRGGSARENRGTREGSA